MLQFHAMEEMTLVSHLLAIVDTTRWLRPREQSPCAGYHYGTKIKKLKELKKQQIKE